MNSPMCRIVRCSKNRIPRVSLQEHDQSALLRLLSSASRVATPRLQQNILSSYWRPYLQLQQVVKGSASNGTLSASSSIIPTSGCSISTSAVVEISTSSSNNAATF